MYPLQPEKLADALYDGPTDIFPKRTDLFRALDLCPFENIQVVIIGQDPYHGPSQAMGLAFSVPDGIPVPPSLKNIYKEIESDTGESSTCAPGGDLTLWAKQGVLLLNSVLTVESGQPGSHARKGWEEYTDSVVQSISDNKEHVVFLLWGAYAQNKGVRVNRSKHCVLETSHPSPLGAHRGFTGCRHFSYTNTYLMKYNKKPITW